MRTAIVLQTHFYNRAIERMFFRLVGDAPDGCACFVMLHVSNGVSPPVLPRNVPHVIASTAQLRNPAYIRKVNDPAGWHFWQGGHTDLNALYFCAARPGFDRYWFIEYDMRFSGSWGRLFAAFEDDPADLLTTTVRRATENPGWMHWRSLRLPVGAAPLPEHQKISAFMPIFRVSRAAFMAIDRAYRAGWAGHCEATWPSIVNAAGLRLADLGGDGEFVAPGNHNRFYTNTPAHTHLSPGSLVFRPARVSVGLRRGCLWHPVKPFRYKVREDARALWVECKRRLRPWLAATRPEAAQLTRQSHEAGAEETARALHPAPSSGLQS